MHIQINEGVYDLVLRADVGSTRHFQWFLFRVSHTRAGAACCFRVVNMEKGASLLGSGMQPVLFSRKRFAQTGVCWTRQGSDVTYCQNTLAFLSDRTNTHASFNTASFTLVFEHDDDECFIAYHYPYSYSCMQAYLSAREGHPFLSRSLLCHTPAGLQCDLLRITGGGRSASSTLPHIIVSARVHPGESNASWVMHGACACLRTRACFIISEYVCFWQVFLTPYWVTHLVRQLSVQTQSFSWCPCLTQTVL